MTPHHAKTHIKRTRRSSAHSAGASAWTIWIVTEQSLDVQSR